MGAPGGALPSILPNSKVDLREHAIKLFSLVHEDCTPAFTDSSKSESALELFFQILSGVDVSTFTADGKTCYSDSIASLPLVENNSNTHPHVLEVFT